MSYLQFKIHNIFYNFNVDICPVSHIAFVEQICYTVLQFCKETKMRLKKWKLLDNEKCHLYVFYGI